jgi:hypothetical protein
MLHCEAQMYKGLCSVALVAAAVCRVMLLAVFVLAIAQHCWHLLELCLLALFAWGFSAHAACEKQQLCEEESSMPCVCVRLSNTARDK